MIKTLLCTEAGRAILLGISVLFIAGILIGLCIAHKSWLPLAIDGICVIFITKALGDVVVVYGRKKYNKADIENITW